MTRADAVLTACEILDDFCERGIERYLDRRGHDAALEDELRREVARWKLNAITEIEQWMAAMERSRLH